MTREVFGGSHAQRDVLSLTAVEAALRGGRVLQAQALLSERQQRKPDSRAGLKLWGRLSLVSQQPIGGGVSAAVYSCASAQA